MFITLGHSPDLLTCPSTSTRAPSSSVRCLSPMPRENGTKMAKKSLPVTSSRSLSAGAFAKLSLMMSLRPTRVTLSSSSRSLLDSRVTFKSEERNNVITWAHLGEYEFRVEGKQPVSLAATLSACEVIVEKKTEPPKIYLAKSTVFAISSCYRVFFYISP